MKRVAQDPGVAEVRRSSEVGMSTSNRPPRPSYQTARVVRFIVCGRCRLTYRSTEWLGLDLVEILDTNCVRQVLSDWPAGHSIEVRHCKRCGEEITRMACAEDASDGA